MRRLFLALFLLLQQVFCSLIYHGDGGVANKFAVLSLAKKEIYLLSTIRRDSHEIWPDFFLQNILLGKSFSSSTVISQNFWPPFALPSRAKTAFEQFGRFLSPPPLIETAKLFCGEGAVFVHFWPKPQETRTDSTVFGGSGLQGGPGRLPSREWHGPASPVHTYWVSQQQKSG